MVLCNAPVFVSCVLVGIVEVHLAEFPWVLLGALTLKWDGQKFQSMAHFVSCGPNFGLSANFVNSVLFGDVMGTQDESTGGKCNKEFWKKWLPRRIAHQSFVLSLWACIWFLGTYPLGRSLSEG